MKEKCSNRFQWILLFVFVGCSQPTFKELTQNITQKELTGPFLRHKKEGLKITSKNNHLSIGNFINFSLTSSFISASQGIQTQTFRMGSFKLKDKNKNFCSNQTMEKIIWHSKNSMTLIGKIYGKNCLADYKF